MNEVDRGSLHRRKGEFLVDMLGIDISKADFHACLIQGTKRTKKSFPNAPVGYRQMGSWLKNRRCTEVHACMEATGSYWEALAKALYDAGRTVSVVNPSQTVFFARSQLRRTKTDAVDAEMIAEFCQQRHPSPWTPPPDEILELRGLLSYREHLIREIVALKQMAEQIHVSKELRKLHLQQLKAFEKSQHVIERQLRVLIKAHPRIAQQVEALTVISGIGLLTALSMVAKLPADRLRNAKAAAAYVGLAPSEHQSGTSIHRKSRICKTGNASLRRDLYMPAIVATRHNPILKAFAERLKARGKPGKVIITAVMRKLVVLAFRILHGLPRVAASAS
jgi:transposase